MIICPNLKNPDVAREFDELKNATSEAAAYHIWSLNNGNAIDKAPNGAESKLFLTLLDYYNGDRTKAIQAKAKTYGTSFLKWFGDWINDPSNASKVVDENGEPLVVYHYTENKFNKFDIGRFGKNDMGDHGRGFYFTPRIDNENGYFRKVYGDVVMPVFLNIKNPVYASRHDDTKMFNRIKLPFKSHREKLIYDLDVEEFQEKNLKETLFGDNPDYQHFKPGSIGEEMTKLRLQKTKENISKIKKEIEELKEDYDENEEYNNRISKFDNNDGVINGDFEIVVPTSNQIKSIDNEGSFSTENNDIYEPELSFFELQDHIFHDKESYVQAKMRLFFLDSKIDLSQTVEEEPVDLLLGLERKPATIKLNNEENITKEDQNIILLDIARKATRQWANERQQRIMGRVLLQLAEAFGLVQQEDGSWETESTDPIDKLRVEFVNSLGHAGHYDHNSTGTAAAHLIQVGLTEGDATTFNHELAHHYVRMMWNSQLIQDALKIVYDPKTMGKDINDPKTREAVEEALIDFMTERSVDDMFKSNIEHKSRFLTLWEGFNKLLYKLFNIKSKAARNAILDQITISFMVNEQLQNDLSTTYFKMNEGRMYQHKATPTSSEYKHRKTKAESNAKYMVRSLVDPSEQLVDDILMATQSKAKSYDRRSAGSEEGIYNDPNQKALNQEAVRQVRMQAATISEAYAAKRAGEALHQKAKMFLDFLSRSNEELMNILRMLLNAKANDYRKLIYNEDADGNKHYLDQNDQYITEANRGEDSKEQQFTFDELQYFSLDTIKFIEPILDSINSLILDADRLGYSTEDIDELRLFMNNSGIINTLNAVDGLYRNALRKKVFNWIDTVVEERTELNEDFKNRLRINMYKWVENQMDYGDISGAELLIGLGSQSKSPIINAIQDTINDMQNELDNATYHEGIRLMDLLRKAKKAVGIHYRVLPMNMLKMLIQLDRRGLPTGYWLEEYNRGQYLQDINAYRDKLLFGRNGLESKLRRLKDDDGNYIFVDADGKRIKHLEIDKYGFPIVPKTYEAELLVKEYLKAFEKYKCTKCERLFTYEYYSLRIDTLSLSTLKALHEIDSRRQDIIRTIMINGKPRVDLLTPSQELELNSLEKQRLFLGSFYDESGNLKDENSDEYWMAEEIMHFKLLTENKIQYSTDLNAFEEAKANAKNKKEFERRFSLVVINPKVWRSIIKSPIITTSLVELNKLLYQRSILLSQFKGHELGEMDWSIIYDEKTGKLKNKQLLKTLKDLDERISHLRAMVNSERKAAKQDASGTMKIEHSNGQYYFDEILEKLPTIVDINGNWYKDLSMYDRIIEGVQQAIMDDDSIPADLKLAKIIEELELLQYHSSSKDTDNKLELFYTYLPRETYIYDLAGNKDKTFIKVPNGIFRKIDVQNSDSLYVNKKYNPENPEIEQLTEEYKDPRYEKYIKNGPLEVKDLYNALYGSMKASWEKMPFLGEYDGRLCQQGARTGQILGRKMFRRLRVFKNIWEFLRREFSVVETDTLFAPEDDVTRRPDGQIIKHIPIRFVQFLKGGPEYINLDVVGSTIQFFDMAENYKIKSREASLYQSIEEFLDLDKVKGNRRDTGQLKTSQRRVLSNMLDKLLYEDNTTGLGKTSKAKFIMKNIGKLRISFQLGMLALNITSGIISFLDPLLSFIIDSATGKYINAWNDVQAFRYLFSNCIGNMRSLGKIKSEGKLAAAMQYMLLGKNNKHTFANTDLSQVMRFLTDGLSMKHFTIGDYTMNSLNLLATCNNYRAYVNKEGNIVDFLPKQLFIKRAIEDGFTYKEARNNYRKAKTFWNSCEVDRKNGEFKPKDNEYGRAISKKTLWHIKKLVQARSSVYNGIVGDTERTLMQTNVFYAFFTMLRNFIITGVWERFKNQRSFLVTSFDEEGNPTYDNISKEISPEEAKRNLRYYKGGYNFNNRQIEDGVDIVMGDFVRHIGTYTSFLFRALINPRLFSLYSTEHDEFLKEHNMNQQTIYGSQKIMLELMCTIALIALTGLTARWADEDPDNYWKQVLALLNARLAVERLTWYNPNTMLEIIQSPTTAISDYKRKLKVFDIFFDAAGFGGNSLNDVMSKNSNFAGQPRWVYDICNAFSAFGLYNWYTNMPAEVGGGDAHTMKKKRNFYKKFTSGAIFNFFSGKKDDDEKESKSKEKTRKSLRRERSRRRSRRNRDED